MSTTEAEQATNYLVIDHNVTEGGQYVTYIVDLWQGRLDDPATQITRYIALFRGDDLETEDGEAIDPDWAGVDLHRHWAMEHSIKPTPLVWETVEKTKHADRDAEQYRDQQAGMLSDRGYAYGEAATKKKLYQAFIEAIDVLATDPENEAAWETVEKYRNYNAKLHEK